MRRPPPVDRVARPKPPPGNPRKPTRLLLTVPPTLTHFIDEDVSRLSRTGVMRAGRQDVIRTILEKHYLEQEVERGKGIITGIRHNRR